MTVETRTRRATGNDVTVGRATELGLDPCGGDCKWYAVCEEHSQLVGFATRAQAERHAVVPSWCSECRAEHDL